MKEVPSSPSESYPTVLKQVSDNIQKNVSMSRHRTFLGYAWALFRGTGLYTVWKNALAYFRRARTVTLIIKIISVLFSILQTGTLVLLSTVLFVILLPLLLLSALTVLLVAAIKSRQSNKMMARMLEGKQVYVLFPTKDQTEFWKANASDLASRADSAVILCSPFWFASKGISSDKFYCTMRREQERIYLVRRYYFFSLKKHVLKDQKLIFLY